MSNYRIDNLQNNLPSLLIGSLYTVNEEYGYIRKKELTKLIHQNPYYLTSNILKPAKDIIIYDKPLLTSSKEVLTDTKIKCLTASLVKTTKFFQQELDTFVYIPHRTHPTLNFLLNYLLKHKDIEEYKKELEMIKEESKRMHLVKKELELDELFFTHL